MTRQVVLLHQVAFDANAHLLVVRQGELVPVTHVQYNKQQGTYTLSVLQNAVEGEMTCTGSQEVTKVPRGEYANYALWHVRPH